MMLYVIFCITLHGGRRTKEDLANHFLLKHIMIIKKTLLD